MGTRHLVCIYHKGRFVVAEYGHCDGYPSAAGVEVLRFLRSAGNIRQLRDNTHFVRLRRSRPKDGAEVWGRQGVSILDDVATASEPVKHFLNLEFASDGLFCEWAYVVDLDGGALEAYQGEDVYEGNECWRQNEAGRFRRAGVVQQVLRAMFAFDALPESEDDLSRLLRRRRMILSWRMSCRRWPC